VKKAIKTGSLSKYPINVKIPTIKQITAIISRRRGGFDELKSDCWREPGFEVFLAAEAPGALFFLFV
jgi:hypothetical protein